MGKDVSGVYTRPCLSGSCLSPHPHFTTSLAYPSPQLWAPASMPYLNCFGPHGICSAWNIPSSLSIELPTPYLRLAPLFNAHTTRISVGTHLLMWGLLISTVSLQESRNHGCFAHWIGSLFFFKLLFYLRARSHGEISFLHFTFY